MCQVPDLQLRHGQTIAYHARIRGAEDSEETLKDRTDGENVARIEVAEEGGICGWWVGGWWASADGLEGGVEHYLGAEEGLADHVLGVGVGEGVVFEVVGGIVFGGYSSGVVGEGDCGGTGVGWAAGVGLKKAGFEGGCQGVDRRRVVDRSGHSSRTGAVM